MDIYTFDNIEAVAAVMRAVPMILNSGESGYRELIKIMGLLGFIAALFAFFLNPTRFAALTYSAGFFLVYWLLFLPTTTVFIYDKGRPGAAPANVENVPVALAAVASISSTVGYKLTQIFEDVTKVADSCTTGPICIFKFSEGGMMGANRFMAKVQEAAQRGFATVDPILERDTSEFLAQCTTFDLSSGRIGYGVLSNSKDLWKDIANTSPARYTTYRDGSVDKFGSCDAAYASITSRRVPNVEAVRERVAKEMFPNLAKDKALEALEATFNQVALRAKVGDASSQARDFLLQNMAINQFKRGIGRAGAESGSASATLLGNAEAVSFASTNASFIVQSRLAEQALPLIRNSVEAILYGIFPIVVLMLLLQQGPAAATAVKGYVFALIWIQLWPPLYALVNYIGQVRSLAAARAITQTASGADLGVVFSNYNDIYNGQLSDQAVIGYLVIAVPAIASAIIYGMNSAAGALGGSGLIGGGGGAAAAVGAGNVQMGNVSVGQQALGPSRVDADVFTNTTTGGTFKSAIGEHGQLRTIGADLNKASGSFKVAVNSQAVDQLKTANAEELSEARARQEQISNSVDVAHAQMIAQQKARSSTTANTNGVTKNASVTDGTEVSDGHVYGKGTNSTNSAAAGEQANDTTGHKFEGGGSAPTPGLTLAAAKTQNWGGGTTGKTETGDASSTSGQENKSTADKLAELQAWAKQQGLSDTEQKMIAVSQNQSLSLNEAAQELTSLSTQISHAEKVSASLEQMDKRQATVENDLMLRSIQELNASMGDATYVQRLSEEQQREQIMARAAHIMQREYGLSEAQTGNLLGAEGRFDKDKINLDHDIGAGNLKRPGELYKEHQGRVYDNPQGLTPDKGVGGGALRQEVEGQLDGGKKGSKMAELREKSGEVVTLVTEENKKAEADIAATTAAVQAVIKDAKEQSAPETVARGLAQGGNEVAGFATGAINTFVETVTLGQVKNAVASPLNGSGLPDIRGNGGVGYVVDEVVQTEAVQGLIKDAKGLMETSRQDGTP